ncbi:MAG: DNA cytosine methyltransferase [Verrucomicrobiales bacterium]|nr:DNA cytosine methyltransferase [Verrucomicrobiales bacterium]
MRSVVSLFTGAGGLDLGFEAAGFETRVALEFDRRCAETLRHNRDWPVINCDIHNYASSEILKTGELRAGEVDVLIGGPPCQPFSKSGFWATGDSKRLEDPRAATLDAYFRILETSCPESFLIENVAGISYKNKSEGLDYIFERIGEINQKRGTNYDPEYFRLNAVNFGVPQLRERVFIIGHRDGRKIGKLEQTHGDVNDADLFANDMQPLTTVWDAIGHLNESSENLELKGKWADLLSSIPEGTNYLYHTDRGEGLPLFGWRRRFWNFLLKVAKNKPSWTITAQPGPATGPFHWQNRHLSAEEMLAIQTFPADYKVLGCRSEAQKQIGNAVPSGLAEFIALKMRARLFGESKYENMTPSLIPAKRSDCPPPEPIEDVLDKYLHLEGAHADHPGTGKGPGALKVQSLANS